MTKVDPCFLCSIIYAYWKRNNNTKFTFSFRLIIYWCLLTCSTFSHNSGLLPQNRVPGQRFFCAKQLCANDLLKAPTVTASDKNQTRTLRITDLPRYPS